MIDRYGVPHINENGERMCGIYALVGICVANSYFQHKVVSRYTVHRTFTEKTG